MNITPIYRVNDLSDASKDSFTLELNFSYLIKNKYLAGGIRQAQFHGGGYCNPIQLHLLPVKPSLLRDAARSTVTFRIHHGCAISPNLRNRRRGSRAAAIRRLIAVGAVITLCLTFGPSGLGATQTDGDSTVVIVPAKRYAASGFRRFFWGDQYRDAWTTPVEVRVLDLRTFAGGLKPVRRLVQSQTAFLIFQGTDGHLYAFRKAERGISSFLPQMLQETIAKDVLDILEANFNAEHPGAQLVTDRLEQAVGVINADARLFAMPDDPLLGKFREEFAGAIGMLMGGPSVLPTLGDDLGAADLLINTDQLFDLVQASPNSRVNSRAFLTARLVDIYLGDWAQERDQWRWVQPTSDPSGAWLPIPINRDQAFAKLDGLFPSKAWHFNQEIVGFREKYPEIIGLHITAQELDRRFLVDLERPPWDSSAAKLKSQLTDEVIDESLRRLPPEMFALDAAEISRILKARRDALPQAASEFYELLAKRVDVHASEVAEDVRISGVDDRRVEVVVAQRSADAAPYYRRIFDSQETREIRIRMHGGDDRAVVRGGERLGIRVRVLGGAGDDELVYATPTQGVEFYDDSGANRVTGSPPKGVKFDERSYEEWVYSPEDPRPRRDWGSRTTPTVKFRYGSDYGGFVEVGTTNYQYGFRKDPYDRRLRLSGGVSTELKVEARADVDLRRQNSSVHYGMVALLSQLDVLNYFGQGNDTEQFREKEFFEVEGTVMELGPFIARSLKPTFAGLDVPTIDVFLGAALNYRIEGDNSGTFIDTDADLYGRGDFSQLGLGAAFKFDSRDVRSAATKGATANLRGTLYPGLLDVRSTYGLIDVVGTTYLTPNILRRPTLALRAGSRKVWGEFPYFESAFIGGSRSLRGWNSERFAGDLSLYLNTELRGKLFRTRAIIPGTWGFILLADVGRVWVDGDSPGGLHWGYGGGIWFSFLGPTNTASLSVARGKERTSIYVDFGFQY
ncbi:MAG: hypothetical protein V3U63_09770 [Gemmatimonadota bacterium]